MKVAISIAVAVVMPFGLFILAGIILDRLLAKLCLLSPPNFRNP